LSSDDSKAEDMLDRLILEIKAVSLLYGSESELKAKLEDRITRSHDESLLRFVKALQTESAPRRGRLVAIALGELLMASILVVAGTVVLVPTVLGVNTLSGVVQYFAERVEATSASTPLSPYLSLFEFAVGVLLVLSAFFALREAATKLKEAGLSIKSGGM
jgi:hypothetical protein